MSAGRLYAQIETRLPWHPKIAEKTPVKYAPAVLGFHTAALCFARANRTDGVILESQIAAIMPATKRFRTLVVQLLLQNELWEVTEGGYYIHDWGDCNLTNEQLESLHSKKAAAGRLGGQAKALAGATSTRQSTSSSISRVEESITSVDKQHVPDSPPLFAECQQALLKAFATFPSGTNVVKLKRMCLDYADATPTALDRINHGIEVARTEGKANPGYAIGCAINAGADEIGPKSVLPDD